MSSEFNVEIPPEMRDETLPEILDNLTSYYQQKLEKFKTIIKQERSDYEGLTQKLQKWKNLAPKIDLYKKSKNSGNGSSGSDMSLGELIDLEMRALNDSDPQSDQSLRKKCLEFMDIRKAVKLHQQQLIKSLQRKMDLIQGNLDEELPFLDDKKHDEVKKAKNGKKEPFGGNGGFGEIEEPRNDMVADKRKNSHQQPLSNPKNQPRNGIPRPRGEFGQDPESAENGSRDQRIPQKRGSSSNRRPRQRSRPSREPQKPGKTPQRKNRISKFEDTSCSMMEGEDNTIIKNRLGSVRRFSKVSDDTGIFSKNYSPFKQRYGQKSRVQLPELSNSGGKHGGGGGKLLDPRIISIEDEAELAQTLKPWEIENLELQERFVGGSIKTFLKKLRSWNILLTLKFKQEFNTLNSYFDLKFHQTLPNRPTNQPRNEGQGGFRETQNPQNSPQATQLSQPEQHLTILSLYLLKINKKRILFKNIQILLELIFLMANHIHKIGKRKHELHGDKIRKQEAAKRNQRRKLLFQEDDSKIHHPEHFNRMTSLGDGFLFSPKHSDQPETPQIVKFYNDDLNAVSSRNLYQTGRTGRNGGKNFSPETYNPKYSSRRIFDDLGYEGYNEPPNRSIGDESQPFEPSYQESLSRNRRIIYKNYFNDDDLMSRDSYKRFGIGGFGESQVSAGGLNRRGYGRGGPHSVSSQEAKEWESSRFRGVKQINSKPVELYDADEQPGGVSGGLERKYGAQYPRPRSLDRGSQGSYDTSFASRHRPNHQYVAPVARYGLAKNDFDPNFNKLRNMSNDDIRLRRGSMEEPQGHDLRSDYQSSSVDMKLKPVNLSVNSQDVFLKVNADEAQLDSEGLRRRPLTDNNGGEELGGDGRGRGRLTSRIGTGVGTESGGGEERRYEARKSRNRPKRKRRRKDVDIDIDDIDAGVKDDTDPDVGVDDEDYYINFVKKRKQSVESLSRRSKNKHSNQKGADSFSRGRTGTSQRRKYQQSPDLSNDPDYPSKRLTSAADTQKPPDNNISNKESLKYDQQSALKAFEEMRAQKNGQNGSDGNPVIQEEDNYSNEGEDQEQRSPHQDVLDNIDIGHQDTEFDEEIPNFKSFYFDRKFDIICYCLSPTSTLINLIATPTIVSESSLYLLMFAPSINQIVYKQRLKQPRAREEVINCCEDQNRILYIATRQGSMTSYDLSFIEEAGGFLAKFSRTTLQPDQLGTQNHPIKLLRTHNSALKTIGLTAGSFALDESKLQKLVQPRLITHIKAAEAKKSGKGEFRNFVQPNKRLFLDLVKDRVIWWKDLKEVCSLRKGVPVEREYLKYTLKDKLKVNFGVNQIWLEVSAELNEVGLMIYHQNVAQYCLYFSEYKRSGSFKKIENLQSTHPLSLDYFHFKGSLVVIAGTNVNPKSLEYQNKQIAIFKKNWKTIIPIKTITITEGIPIQTNPDYYDRYTKLTPEMTKTIENVLVKRVNQNQRIVYVLCNKVLIRYKITSTGGLDRDELVLKIFENFEINDLELVETFEFEIVCMGVDRASLSYIKDVYEPLKAKKPRKNLVRNLTARDRFHQTRGFKEGSGGVMATMGTTNRIWGTSEDIAPVTRTGRKSVKYHYEKRIDDYRRGLRGKMNPNRAAQKRTYNILTGEPID